MGLIIHGRQTAKRKSLRNYLVLILFLQCSLSLFSQTTIWNENFSYGNGTETGTATGPSASDWSTNRGGRLSVRNNTLRGRNLDSEGTWQTDPIDITGYGFISFSMETWVDDEDEMDNGNDYFRGAYRIDGGSWQQFVNASGSDSDPLDPSYTVNLSTTGNSTLEIRVQMLNHDNDEQYYIDDVSVVGYS